MPTLDVTTEKRVVAKTTLEFLCEDPDPLGGLTALRVTLDADGLTVHDQWDKSQTDFHVHWLDLRNWARHDKALQEEQRELELTRKSFNESIDEARCVVSGKVVALRPGCGSPECSRPFAVLGPLIRGMRDRCDEEGIPVHRWPHSVAR